jgi:hypothetical protein
MLDLADADREVRDAAIFNVVLFVRVMVGII